MNFNKLAIVLAVSLFVAACATDITEQDITQPASGTSITLSIDSPTSRTVLGERTDEATYPLYWSEGDRISINGVTTNEAVIDADNPRSAIFYIDATLQYPYSILYPASADGTIEFAAEQSFTKGSFEGTAMPMYAYATSGEKCEMKHLGSLLQFTFTGAATLASMELTAEQGALAGHYAIDCSTGTLGEAANTSPTINYSFGDGLKLSDEPQAFFVALPAGDHGTCSAILRDKSGRSMRLRFDTANDKALRRGVVREFQMVEYRIDTNCTLSALDCEEGELELINVAQGTISYDDGTPAAGVVVSDGFNVVRTDKDGRYCLKPSSDCYYIYISLPADCEIPTDEHGQPLFFIPYEKSRLHYDFTLRRLEGGAEQKFAFYALADPHQVNTTRIKRMQNETIPILKTCTENDNLPSYGIVLGDIVSSSSTTDSSPYMPTFRTNTHIDKTGVPLFKVMGNHDVMGKRTVTTDEHSSTLELAAQRTFEECFGPINYSFNRGKVHFVCMRDILYRFDVNGDNNFNNYTRGFTKEQYEWLVQDLAAVPKENLVILCVHIPLSAQSTKTTYYIKQVYDLLSQFAGSHVLSGHNHNITNTKATSYDTTEQIVGALGGAWWYSALCTGGAPNGFAVYYIDGNKIADHYYQGVNKGYSKRSVQMRIYRGNMVAGGQYEYFTSPYSGNTIVANIWNSKDSWDVRAYLGDKELGQMTRLTLRTKGDPWLYDINGNKLAEADYDAQVSTIQAQTSTSNPTQFTDQSTVDWYCIGYHIGVKKRKRSDYLSAASYTYTLENEALATADWSKVKVVAIDEFGTRYECSDVIQGTVNIDFDYSEITAPTW